MPQHWDISAADYREQILAKRRFWRSKGITFLETHTGMMASGRPTFENTLQVLLQDANIQCQRLPEEDIVARVFENDFAISHMAKLFLQFIQRAKKRGWSVDEVSRRISNSPDKQLRARLFHQLALRAYREYETMLDEQQRMDFDDLLLQAVEEVSNRGASASIHLGKGRTISIGEMKWILIDEYQDFSELYFRMLNAILKANETIRLVAVGDDWQAINGFAGAELRFFDQFTQLFSKSEKVGITINYRSARSVVAAGNQLMQERGNPAKANSSALGYIAIKHIDDVWIEFRPEKQFRQVRESDALYRASMEEGKNPSPSELREARALKLCTQIILEAPEQKTMLLARTNYVYGRNLTDFSAKLIGIIANLCRMESERLERRITAMTAHRSKGQEADRVIILDVTRKQFPKIHPDNLLFEPFGVTPEAVLEEERRLFYVAITRAEHSLYILTERGQESPYIKLISQGSNGDVFHDTDHADQTATLGAFAKGIQAQIRTLEGGGYE